MAQDVEKKFCLSGVRCRKMRFWDLNKDDSYGENIPGNEALGNHLDSGSKGLVNILKYQRVKSFLMFMYRCP